MQLVGRECAVCRQPVIADTAGVGCSACDVVFHVTCVDSEECPSCHRNFGEMKRASEQARREESWRIVRAGRRKVLLCIAALVGLHILSITVSVAFLGGAQLTFQVCGLLFAGIQFAFLYLGHAWARLFLQLSLGLGSALMALHILHGVRESMTGLVVESAILFAIYASILAVLTASSSVKRFLEEQRARG